VKLDNTFYVHLPVDQAWSLLTDLPRIAPCLPGAHLDETVDGRYNGGIRTKIGPVTARYAGSATFAERDDVGHRAVIQAHGSEEQGHGAATATIVATLRPEHEGTTVDVSTELTVSGRAAQFGRSLLGEVSEAMLTEFSRRLEDLANSDGRTGEPAADQAEVELDVLRTMIRPVLRRAAVPALVLSGIAAAALVGWAVGGRR
jgi:carbon monoxide dehydrogenase subunit G